MALLTPSVQIVRAFDSVLKMNKTTEQVVTLDLNPDDNVQTYIDKQTKIN